MRAVHLEKEVSGKEADAMNKDPNKFDGVMEECIVCLARVVKEAQQDKKCCYHYSSMEYFIHECPLMKASTLATHLNWKEGTSPEKGDQTPQVKMAKSKASQKEIPKA